MCILLTICSWNPALGGPFFSVGNLARALASVGHEVHLLAGTYPHLPPEPEPEGVHLHLVPGRLIRGIRQTWIPCARAQLDVLIREVAPDVIHDNGLWLTLNHKIAQAAKRHDVPLLLSPRGTLAPWALQYQNWKKRIALAIYQRRDLGLVSCFHAASPLEAKNIRDFGLSQPSAVIPNGVRAPEEPARFDSNDVRIALFVGRMHPVKNLPTLLNAWAKVKPKGWRLRLFGADEVNHKAVLRDQIRELNLGESVEILDPIYGDAKERCLQEAQLFFLVSKSENFGVAAAEAMAAGLPVIASRETPWSCLEEHELGWWVPGRVDELAQAIEAGTSKSPEELFEIGSRGRKYARESFGWGTIANDFVKAYDWMRGNQERPLFIR